MDERKDRLIRFLLPQAHTRGAIIRASHIVEDASLLHGLNRAPAEVLGKALIASILLLSVSKGGTRQVLQLDSHPGQPQMPISRILAEARPGMVRGYLNWGDEGAIVKSDRDEHLAAWMGRPIRTTVVRDLGIGQPYISSIEHDSDYMADHILHFLTQSAQIQSDVILCGDLGILIEAMPGCDQEHWFKAVEALARIPQERLKTEEPEAIVQQLTGLDCKVVGEDNYIYRCGCSADSLVAALHTLPAEQLREIADEAGRVTLSCQYCNENYEVDIRAILDR